MQLKAAWNLLCSTNMQACNPISSWTTKDHLGMVRLLLVLDFVQPLLTFTGASVLPDISEMLLLVY